MPLQKTHFEQVPLEDIQEVREKEGTRQTLPRNPRKQSRKQEEEPRKEAPRSER